MPDEQQLIDVRPLVEDVRARHTTRAAGSEPPEVLRAVTGAVREPGRSELTAAGASGDPRPREAVERTR